VKNQSKFHLQKSFWDFNPPIESYWQNSERMFEKCKKNPFQPPLWILSITFCWWIEISNGFQEMKAWLIFHINVIQFFLKKVILLCLNKVWNSTSNTIYTFDLIMSSWMSTINVSWWHGLASKPCGCSKIAKWLPICTHRHLTWQTFDFALFLLIPKVKLLLKAFCIFKRYLETTIRFLWLTCHLANILTRVCHLFQQI